MSNNRISILLGYFKAQWRLLILAVIAIVVVATLDLAVPYTFGLLLVDNVIISKNVSLLPLIIAILAAVIVGDGLFTTLKSYSIELITQRIAHKMRCETYTHLQFLPLSYHDNAHSGDLLARLSSDIDDLKGSINVTLQNTLTDLITVIVTIMLMFSLNITLTLYVLPTVPLLVVVVNFFKSKVRSSSAKIRQAVGKMFARAQESIGGIRIVKSFSKEKYESDRFADESLRIVKANVAMQKLEVGYSISIDAISVVSLMIVVVLATPSVIAGQFTLGALFTYLIILNKLYKPTRELTTANLRIQKMLASIDRISEIMDVQPEAAGELKLPKVKGAVKFDGVTFTYPNGGFTLQDFSLDIKPGEKVAFVGHSGSGKTTILSLIMGFYKPDTGKIYIDSVPMNELDLNDYRGSIGVVFQEPFLFSGTIKENVLYGKPSATDLEVAEALKIANADIFIKNLPEGYEYDIGEGGTRLSAGQKQRIAIARAIIRAPSILILDEATSNVDSESESLIREALTRVMEGRTTIIIAHQFTNVAQADKIVVMDNGKVVEIGTHESLIQISGVYSRLYSAQHNLGGK
ncbi:MAG: ABC transporter ATP-binding protein/permease [Thaumarchaeota archaeon]|nr:ABC transporter ATP-binding protein/permease [Nitrososphaerota archaeon]MCL5317665.1 ABC transporter ATP-binding protein/permease [Nitrososphaerota archaeon]